ncbi:unnamed protein product [Rotaria sp. Silwood2]|nr:unnamed protein product [Rotaria sp. Silwood2]CAF3186753.1 unnamed protein product [Rotaria sp. Silwood2]CAF3318503.1 unnamed protein product [Rotaria sp. Silwood2]CAF4128480.1 unnamed protein product [Rotaria sp. Silwood2]CAF4199909.1 unnamed protein product [Rotaria sp. Silwood2]
MLTVFVHLIQNPILVIAQSNQFIPTDISNSRSTRTVSTTIFTMLNKNNNDNVYENENENEIENNAENIYDDDDEIEEEEDDFSIDSPSKTVPQSKLNNSITSYLNEDTQFNEYDDEISSYQDDGDDVNGYIFTNAIPVNRPVSKHPIIDSNNKQSLNSQSTSRMPSISSHIFHILLSRPAILVGIIGGICIGMVSAILLVMFIVYRMRKKDEGSYALEEGPRKSPTHAYSKVSSKEFYA